MTSTDPKASAVHYPPDRRLSFWLRPSLLWGLALLILVPVLIAWGQALLFGLPTIAPSTPSTHPGAAGFPAWLRIAHYVNFLLMVLLIRSGLSILVDHPRLYRRRDCTPGSEWARLTPLAVPTDRLWTAKDDARYISPLLALPGYRHTIGVARHWHFLSVLFWVVNGLIYVVLLFALGHWVRLVPLSLDLVNTWNIFVHYAALHLPPEPDGFYVYQSLQQLAYFTVVFIMAPLSLLTGLAMSPALDGHLSWYPRLFGGRQGARSLHFLLMVGFTAFLVIHVTLVVITGFARNMNHIVLGQDTASPAGWILGLTGILVVVAVAAAAHWVSWHRPRALQAAASRTVGALTQRTLDPLQPRAEYRRSDVSPYFWPNGKLPTSEEWLALAAAEFRDYRLRVSGLVERPLELSLDELRALGKQEQITLHHCIQGWSGVAEWGGLPLAALLELARPQPGAQVVVFRSFGEGLHGGEYYETLSLADARHPQTLLAYEMNGSPLGTVYGAPLRLRVENQLGYKMIKWIRSIELVASEKQVGKGFGGKNEDDEYFGLLANI